MLKNYIKIAFRQLWQHKLFSALNIFGLATSMSVCLLLILILADQYNYDAFHEKGEQIYRVTSASSGQQVPEKPHFATTSVTVADELREDYPFIESIVRLLNFGAEVRIDIGVTSNFFHDDIWFEPIKPFGFRQNTDNPIQNASIKLQEATTSESLAAIQDIWQELSPESSMNAFFIDERMYHLSKFFNMGAKIIGFVGFLTIIIACMGLLGIVLYTVEGKLKEVGIRKVLGASKESIIWQLSKGFFLLLAIAIVIATPLTIFGATAWLQNFATQTTISLGVILSSIGIIVLLGLVTVISQTYWAARSNPVESLRSE